MHEFWGTLVDDARRMEVAFSLKPCVDHFVPDPFAYSAPGHLSEPVSLLVSHSGTGSQGFAIAICRWALKGVVGDIFRDKETRGKERLGKNKHTSRASPIVWEKRNRSFLRNRLTVSFTPLTVDVVSSFAPPATNPGPAQGM
jgi:hypothetical protein